MKKPIFLSDQEKYDWLLKNPEQIDEHDARWMAWFKAQPSFGKVGGDECAVKFRQSQD